MFALLYQFWFYVLSPENEWSQVMVAAILGETGSSKFIVRLVTIQVLLSNFTLQNNCFMITLCRKCTFNNFTLLQFALLLEICVKRSYQTVHVFHLRLCRLLEGPKRPIKTESIMGKIPYRGASSNLEHNSTPGRAPESLPNLEREKMVC